MTFKHDGRSRRKQRKDPALARRVAVHFRVTESMHAGLVSRGKDRGEQLSETIRRVLADYLEASK